MLNRLKIRMFDSKTGVMRKALELLWHSQTKERSIEEFKARPEDQADDELPGQGRILGAPRK